MKAAFLLYLLLKPLKKIAFKLRDGSATQAGHVDVVARGALLIIVALAFHVHQIQFVNQPVPFQ